MPGGGERGAIVQPTGTVTFLFTDIEGSTRLWQRDSAKMAVAQATHDRILHERLESHGGFVFSSAGDGLGAAFSDPDQALRAAIAAQLDLAANHWPEDAVVTVRMGLHTGNAEERDGDYFGHEVNKSARVMSVGHGGQILLSGAAAELLRTRLEHGLRLEDLGEHRMKDIAELVRVYQLVHPALRSDFPALNSGQQARGNLPEPATNLIGRDHDVGELVDGLRETRALTLLGPGGVGKTRLALAVATEVAGAYSAGAWFIELATIGDSGFWFAIAGELGILEQPGLDIEASVVAWLKNRELLLVLDNCEHVVDTAAKAVDHILRSCPSVTLILTSREALGVGGEQIYRVRPLGIDSDDANRPAPAEVLFMDRARAVSRELRDDAATREAVRAIVRHLDGLPLAIELAAAQTRALSPTNIAARLDERFRLLSGGRRASIERHQTLRATVDWSYGLLTAQQQHLFDRLSAFYGDFNLEAAEEIGACADVDRFDVFSLVADLADKSMIVVDYSGEETRYSMLETLRAYGSERLVERQEAQDVGDALVTAFLRVSDEVQAGMLSPAEASARRRFVVELDNIRAAFNVAMMDGDLDAATLFVDRLAFALGMDYPEVMSWADQILDASVAASTATPRKVLAPLIYGLATRGRFEEGEAVAAEQLRRDDLDSQDRGAIKAAVALIAFFSGDLERSIDLLAEAQSAGLENRQYELYLMSDVSLANAYLGRTDVALEELAKYQEVVAELDSPTARGYYEYCLGEVLSEIRPQEAIGHLERAVELTHAAGNHFAEGISLVTLASLLGRHGESARAARAIRDAVCFFADANNLPPLWTTIRNLIEVLCRLEVDEDAAVLLGAQDAAVGASTLFGEGERRLVDARNELGKRLGPAAFAAALDRGSKMSETEAVPFALATIDRLVAALSG